MCMCKLCIFVFSTGSSWSFESCFPACVRIKTACTWPGMLGSRRDHPCLTLEQDSFVPDLQPDATQLEGCDQTEASLLWERGGGELGRSARCSQSLLLGIVSRLILRQPWLPSLQPLNSLVVPGMSQELERHPHLYIPEGLAPGNKGQGDKELSHGRTRHSR